MFIAFRGPLRVFCSSFSDHVCPLFGTRPLRFTVLIYCCWSFVYYDHVWFKYGIVFRASWNEVALRLLFLLLGRLPWSCCFSDHASSFQVWNEAFQYHECIAFLFFLVFHHFFATNKLLFVTVSLCYHFRSSFTSVLPVLQFIVN
jgi:hypothetical protein